MDSGTLSVASCSLASSNYPSDDGTVGDSLSASAGDGANLQDSIYSVRCTGTCPAGEHVNPLDQNSCAVNPPGTFSSSSGGGYQTCPPGKHQAADITTNAAAGTDLPANHDDENDCDRTCPAGRYADGVTSVSDGVCPVCKAATFQTAGGGSACR